MGLYVKNTTFPSLFELLAPHSCRGCGCLGSPLCNCCKNYIKDHHQNFCPHCKAPNSTGICPHCQNLPPTFIAGKRSDLLAHLIQDYKYSSVRALAQPLAEIMHHALPAIDQPFFIVPLPTISRHIRERGFDHTYKIAKALSKFYPDAPVQKLLLRSNNAVQVGANKTSRLLQATSAYRINPKIKINPSATYLLFDDVWTTGASMLAAIKKLRQAGVSQIIIGILAVSE